MATPAPVGSGGGAGMASGSARPRPTAARTLLAARAATSGARVSLVHLPRSHTYYAHAYHAHSYTLTHLRCDKWCEDEPPRFGQQELLALQIQVAALCKASLQPNASPGDWSDRTDVLGAECPTGNWKFSPPPPPGPAPPSPNAPTISLNSEDSTKYAPTCAVGVRVLTPKTPRAASLGGARWRARVHRGEYDVRCAAIVDKSECCATIDSAGDVCVPAVTAFSDGAVCAGWEASLKISKADATQIAACPPQQDREATAARPRVKLPAQVGCDSLTDRVACCSATDGRTMTTYADSPCIPATLAFQSGAVCEAVPKVLAVEVSYSRGALHPLHHLTRLLQHAAPGRASLYLTSAAGTLPPSELDSDGNEVVARKALGAKAPSQFLRATVSGDAAGAMPVRFEAVQGTPHTYLLRNVQPAYCPSGVCPAAYDGYVCGVRGAAAKLHSPAKLAT